MLTALAKNIKPKYTGAVYIGLHLYDGNPYIHGNTFADFYDDEYKVSGAIGHCSRTAFLILRMGQRVTM